MKMALLLVTISLVHTVHSQTIYPATISNATGDYFLSLADNDFAYGEVICNSTELCYIECHHRYSCRNSKIRCGFSKQCVISCNEYYACGWGELYSNAVLTSLSCTFSNACRSLGIAYVNSPTFDWFCADENYACRAVNSMATLASSFIVSDNFTLTCNSYLGCYQMQKLNISANRILFECNNRYSCSSIDISMSLSNYAHWNCFGESSCKINTIRYPNILTATCFGLDSCTGLAHQPPNIAANNVSVDGEELWSSTVNMDFIDVIMNCTNNVLCEYNCIHDESCRNNVFYCNNVEKCIINCECLKSCQSSTVYTESANATINCRHSYACDGMTVHTFTNTSKLTMVCKSGSLYGCDNLIFNNSINSDITLFCSDGTCNDISVSQRPQNNLNAFKLFCIDAFGGCQARNTLLAADFPLASAVVSNQSVEYYVGFGSYINVSCTHNKSCVIDCADGSCWYSFIHCSDTDKCKILCPGAPTANYEYSCRGMDITASDINDVFVLQCGDGSYPCILSRVTINNANSIDIQCGLSTTGFSCHYMEFYIDNIGMIGSNDMNMSYNNSLNVNCDGGWGCHAVTFYIKNVETADINCGLQSGCNKAVYNITNVADMFVSCPNPSSCAEMNIASNSNDSSSYIEIDCASLRSCGLMDICAAESILNLRCCGDDSCGNMKLCDSMVNNIKIDCNCGGNDACSEFNETSSPTMEPTTFIPTLPTISPTTASPTQPTFGPTATTWNPTYYPTALTSNPTISPSAQTLNPTTVPTEVTFNPTTNPTQQTIQPTYNPTTREPTTLSPTETGVVDCSYSTKFVISFVICFVINTTLM